MAGPKKDELLPNLRYYWPIRSELAMIDGIAMKGKRIRIPFLLQKKILQQFLINRVGIQKTRLLAFESVYWININTDVRNTVKQCAT